MKLKVLIGMLILTIALVHCNKNKNFGNDISSKTITIDETKTANVRFVLKASVETDFVACPRLAVSPYQNKVILYGLSSAKNEKSDLVAHTYDKLLKFLNRKTFMHGQGPGDVGNNNIISIGKDQLMISENSNQRVSIYDNDWNYKTSFRHKFEIDAFEAYEDGKCFISADSLDNGKKEEISFFTGSIYDFKIRRFFKTDFSFRNLEKKGIRKYILGGGTNYSWFYRNNRIFILDCAKYRLLKFDARGKQLKDITVKMKKKKTDQSLIDEYSRDQGIYNYRKTFIFNDTVDPTAAMIPLSKGFVVIRRQDYSSNCNGMSDGDYFTDNLEYVGKVKIPCFFELLMLGFASRKNESVKFDNGFLYLVQERDDKTMIEKWQVLE
ncbi:MAG: hypothetical protein ACM3SY_19075 [Candidatus Omnitrophota bacterium]